MSDHPICVCDHGSAWHYTSQWGHTAVCHFGNCACTRYRPRGMWEEMQMKDGTKVTRLSDAALSDAFDLLDDMEEVLSEREAANARCAELERRCQRMRARIHRDQAERDALQATLDRVTALADEWESEARHWTDQAEAMAGDKRAKSYALASKYQLHADRVRAALTPEGKP